MSKKTGKTFKSVQKEPALAKATNNEENMQGLINISVPTAFNHLSAAAHNKNKPKPINSNAGTAFFAELQEPEATGAMTSRAHTNDN